MLKSQISQALYLALVDMTNEFVELIVYIDASQYTLGGFFLAYIGGSWRSVVYYSHKFNLDEVNYIVQANVNC